MSKSKPFPSVQPRTKLTRQQIADAYEAALVLLDLSGNYEIFGEKAEEAEEAFGTLIHTLQEE